MAVKNNTYNIQEVGLAKALVRKGNTCDILFWTDKQEEIIEIPISNGNVIHVFYRHGKTLLKNTVFFDCEDLFNQYDVLQPCEYNQMQAWLLAKRQPRKTVIYHGPYYSAFNERYNLMCKVFDVVFLKEYIRKCTSFLVKSNLAKDFLVSKGIQASNVCVVGVGIDAEMLSSDNYSCKEELFLKMKEDKDCLKLLYVGRIEERRNIPFIFEIFEHLLHKVSNVKLYMIGNGEPNYVSQVFDYAKQLGINNHIIWQEKMEQKYLSQVYSLSDFFLLPTEYEIFGMVLLEAMYYKNVVLTTRNGGSSTLIENGLDGFVMEEMDPDKWANCLVETYENQDRMREIQKNASLKISNHFTWDALADKFIEQYREKVKENN